jgi:hypothetical protein
MKAVTVLNYMGKWFAVKGLSLNLDKTKVVKFNLNHLQDGSFQFPYKDRHIKEVTNIKYLGLEIHKHMYRKTHIIHIMPELRTEWYTLSCTYHFSNINTRKIYYTYFHSIMKYGTLLWDNFMVIKRVFQLQKKIMRIIMEVNSRSSCK